MKYTSTDYHSAFHIRYPACRGSAATSTAQSTIERNPFLTPKSIPEEVSTCYDTHPSFEFAKHERKVDIGQSAYDTRNIGDLNRTRDRYNGTKRIKTLEKSGKRRKIFTGIFHGSRLRPYHPSKSSRIVEHFVHELRYTILKATRAKCDTLYGMASVSS